MDDDNVAAVVIDSGSGNCRAGFAGDDAPRTVFSSVVGRPRFHHEDRAIDSVIGDEAQTMREFLCIKYPIEKGIVTNWDDAEKIWEFCFKDLRIDPTDRPVFMSEPVLIPSGNKELMIECMFETFNVPAYFSQNEAILTLFNCGRVVGLVLDIGEGVTSAVPIHYTSGIPHSILRQEFAGRDVTMYLQKLLHLRDYSFTTTAELEYVRELKEELCYTSMNFDEEMLMPEDETPFILPDGNKLNIGKEKFQCAECLFNPSLMGFNNLKGLHEMLMTVLESCDSDIRKDFYCNILLSGGGSCMRNLPERLDTLFAQAIPSRMRSHVVAVPESERKYSVWIGGSISASLSSIQQVWIKKEDYEEYGPTIVHRRSG